MDEKALRNIIRRIQDDANRKIEEYKRIAEERRKEILEKSRENLEKEIRELRSRYEREIANSVNYILSQAKIRGRRRILEEREKGINAVFSQAIKMAEDDPRYRKYLEKAVRRAKETMGSGTIVCRKKDEAALRAMLPPDFQLKAELDEGDAGVMALSSDGRRILDRRISRVMDDMREDLRKDVSAILYGGAPQ